MKFDLPQLAVQGSPKAMGQQQGEHWREAIQKFVDVRWQALQTYLSDRQTLLPDWVSITQACMSLHRDWHEDGLSEHEGIAEGALIDPVKLYLTTNMTDIRDIFVLGTDPQEEGCTSILLPGAKTKSKVPIVGQTWDLNPPDIEFVAAIHRSPTHGLKSWTVSCVGCLSLVGINEKGVCVGTTNIKTEGSKAGIGYLGLLHKLLQMKSSRQAGHLINQAPRSGAHVYWVADAHDQFEFETSPNRVVVRSAENELVCHTNHCLDAVHQSIQGEVASESSQKRVKRMEDVFADGRYSAHDVKLAFSNRDDGIFSVNRYAEDEQGTATNSVMIAEPHAKRAFMCRGPADRGQWYIADFETTSLKPYEWTPSD